MDSESTLKRIASEISLALTKYAEKEGWEEDEYWIYYHINSDWNYVNFIYVSSHFDREDEHTNYLKVWDFLVDYFKDNRAILKYSTVIVRSKAQVDEGGLNSIGPKYLDYRESLTFYPVPHP